MGLLAFLGESSSFLLEPWSWVLVSAAGLLLVGSTFLSWNRKTDLGCRFSYTSQVMRFTISIFTRYRNFLVLGMLLYQMCVYHV
jgi:hypothetical protein